MVRHTERADIFLGHVAPYRIDKPWDDEENPQHEFDQDMAWGMDFWLDGFEAGGAESFWMME